MLNSQTRNLLFIFIAILFSVSCSQKVEVERAFYYWKTNEYRFEKQERSLISKVEPKTIYVKFFEVEKDGVFGAAPVSKTRFSVKSCNYEGDYGFCFDSTFCDSFKSVNVIPTVFVKNDVFKVVNSQEIDTLASNIIFLVNKYFKQKDFESISSLKEIQIDCDWTPSTKENYFSLLKSIQNQTKAEISVTLRLYPFKYREKMGIPPVSKATLMCYNYFNPLQRLEENSIQNNEELKLYLKGADNYPLHLDIALPVFNYAFLFHNKQFAGVLRGVEGEIDSFCKPMEGSDLLYAVTKDTVIDNSYLRVGDQLKIELSNTQQVLESIDLLKNYIQFDGKTRITLFHLDAERTNELNHEEIISIYKHFAE
ncbi:MAG: hypothetical protein JXQ87_06265 [Bacteroidia bacterium]